LSVTQRDDLRETPVDDTPGTFLILVNKRRYGFFERCFSLPEGIDIDKISANFKKGVLTVTLPKTVEAQKPDKKIAVKSA
jgi:HSP20 family molecular chaperone IbpA